MKCRPAARSNVHNPIRRILEAELKPPQNHAKTMVNLGLGEPSKANGFDLPPAINASIIEAIESEKHNGYTHSTGALPARQAIAEKFGTEEHPINPAHVFLAFGCSGALYNAMSVICEVGDRILVPKPGFPLCQPICENLGIEFDCYNLLAEEGWKIDLAHLRSQITEKTKAILVNNPSNPCGASFTAEHIQEILAVADEFKIPIIADEVYYGLSYDPERPFISMGNSTSTVPVICTGAISKIYCLPGWRCGWTIVYNNHGYFDEVIERLNMHSAIQLHPNSLVQQALPRILKEVPDSHFETMKAKLSASSQQAFEVVSRIRGVTPIRSSAAMYMMVRIDFAEFSDITDDVDFCKKLLNEQNCLTFPSKCFFEDGFFRMIICTTSETINEFGVRLQEFCDAHYKQQ